MTHEQIKHMVDRFLGWRLPDNFSPDDGISFQPDYNAEYNASRGLPPSRRQPSGTNLFDAWQAEVMIRYMLEGLPPPEIKPSDLVSDARLRDLWKAAGGSVDKKNRAFLEVYLLPDALRQVIDRVLEAKPTPADGRKRAWLMR